MLIVKYSISYLLRCQIKASTGKPFKQSRFLTICRSTKCFKQVRVQMAKESIQSKDVSPSISFFSSIKSYLFLFRSKCPFIYLFYQYVNNMFVKQNRFLDFFIFENCENVRQKIVFVFIKISWIILAIVQKSLTYEVEFLFFEIQQTSFCNKTI